MSELFSPVSLGPISADNRIVVAPMCQYSAEEGNATDWHIMHLGNLGLSGAGTVIIEATAVEACGRITPGCLGLFNDDNEQALARVLKAVRPISTAKWMIQLNHAGRKASSARPWEGGTQLSEKAGGWLACAPSAVAHLEDETLPEALDEAGLARVKAAFVETATRAVRLGFDGIELHAAHGYLLHQFLSPVSNHRQDNYGGDLANRMRFVLEVFDAVKEVVPDHVALGIRVSATDWVDDGWDLAQTTVLAQELKARGCDFIDVSSGGVSAAQQIKLEPGYQVPLAEAIKSATGMTTIAVGLITEAEQAEAIIATEKADLVALARGVLYDPRWGWHAAAKLGASVSAPPQYWRCQPRDLKALFQNTRQGQR
ncbi:MAG: NADH:flavin oxidoreductase/NADH oxidase [Orrella sp.]